MTAAKAEAADEGTAEEDSQRRERVKARWSMLRQALLGTTATDGVNNSKGGGSSAADDHNNNNDRFNEHSMNAFPGFQVLDRTVISRDEDKTSAAYNDDILNDENYWDIVQNSYTSTKGYKVQFLTREATEQTNNHKQQSQKSTIQSRVEALLSHRNHGVDNTGNVRVWDAEGTLAGFLLSVVLDGHGNGESSEGSSGGQAAQLSNLRENLCSMLITNASRNDTTGQEGTSCNLLELGAGQAGLAGLAMASASSKDDDKCGNYCAEINTQMKPLHVVLTDGHPKCVDNNDTCAKLMMSEREDVTRIQIEAHLLLWDSSAEGAHACCQINKLVSQPPNVKSNNDRIDEGSYQLCLASDCVHFQEFHDGLLNTIARTLSVDGIALLCQPKRGTSLKNFMALVDAVNASYSGDVVSDHLGDVVARSPLFQVTLFEDFYPKVSAMHKALSSEGNNEAGRTSSTTTNSSNIASQQSSQYDPNWHRPLLLVLQKLRTYDEVIDGEVARHHIKMRGQPDNSN